MQCFCSCENWNSYPVIQLISRIVFHVLVQPSPSCNYLNMVVPGFQSHASSVGPLRCLTLFVDPICYPLCQVWLRCIVDCWTENICIRWFNVQHFYRLFTDTCSFATNSVLPLILANGNMFSSWQIFNVCKKQHKSKTSQAHNLKINYDFLYSSGK